MIGLLQKCLQELDKPEPRLDYIRGILDTLIEVNTPDKPSASRPVPESVINQKTRHMPGPVDEASVLEANVARILPRLKADTERMNG